MSDGSKDGAGLPGVTDGGDLIEMAADPADLERLAADASITGATAAGAAEPLVLSLEDLLPDTDGEVVVLTEDLGAVNLVTNEALAGQGMAAAHVTAGGLEVDGLHYYSFANGVTLYSDTDLLIIQESVGG